MIRGLGSSIASRDDLVFPKVRTCFPHPELLLRSNLPVPITSPPGTSQDLVSSDLTPTELFLTAVTAEFTCGLGSSELVNLTHQLWTEPVPATGLSSLSLIPRPLVATY